MIVEAVRSTELQTGRFGAEYAHPGAAVLSYETREGMTTGDLAAQILFRGSARRTGLQLGSFYPRVVFSGPIVKEQLWFSQSFDVLHTINIERDLPSNANETQQWGGDSWSRLLWKFVANSSLAHRFSVQRGDRQQPGAGRAAPANDHAGCDDEPDVWLGERTQYWEKTLFEFGGGRAATHYDASPQGTAPYCCW